MMLDSGKIFSGFSVDDLRKAKTFYSETLELKVVPNPMGILELFSKGNNPMVIYEKPDHVPASFTVLNFPVDDIDQAVETLAARGVEFLQYSGELQTDEKGIMRGDSETGAPDIAWFTDPAGNILSVLAEVENR